jgi:pimeloyl-ACP methyl ester carboxylesterase
MIARQGSIEAGGRLVYCSVCDSGDPDNPRFPGGHVMVDHVYATYQYPADQRYPHPILLNPGGGHTARVYDTTPDGREGWLTQFLRKGFAVYGVDRPNSGRSGTDITRQIAVRLGQMQPHQLPAMNRYSAEAAWVAFRWGPKYGEPYPETQFPIEAVQAYYPQTVTSYRDPQEVGKTVAAYTALIDKVGPSILLTWSSSGLLGYLAAIERPDQVKAILAIESSTASFPNIPESDLTKLARVPILVVIGDRAEDRVVAAREFQQRMAKCGGRVFVDALPEAGIRGNGHTLMLERNNVQILDRMVAWLDREVYGKA